MTVSDDTHSLFRFSLSHFTFSQLKLLQLSNLTVSPSECPADKEKMEKKNPLNTKNICFAFVKHCISFDYFHNITQRNISKCLDVFGGLFTRLPASISPRAPQSECVTHGKTT